MKSNYLPINKLYDKWARVYDKENNLIMFLEEQITRKMFDFSGKDILDLGCGTGRYAINLARKNNVTAVDMNSRMLNLARKKAREARVKIDFFKSDVTKYSPKKKYDVILSMLVHDHVKNLDSAAKIIASASKKGTVVFVSNVSPEFERVEKKVNKTIFENFYTDEYYHPLSEYKKIFKKNGFDFVSGWNIVFHERLLDFIEIDNFSVLKNKKLGVIYKFRRRN